MDQMSLGFALGVGFTVVIGSIAGIIAVVVAVREDHRFDEEDASDSLQS